jgi:integrase
MKGIDKRTHKDGTLSYSYRARVRIKGHPVLIQSFASKTLAMKWKRDKESAVEQGKYEYIKPGSKNTLAELIDRYIKRVLPSKPKNARNVRQHLLWWKQELGHCLLSDIKPSLIAQKRDELLSGLTYKNTIRSSTTVVRYLASLSHAFAIAVKDWEWIQENPIMKISKSKISNGRTRFLSDSEKERLIQSCRESESKGLYPIVILALSTGMRRGEIMNLKWSDIDLGRGSILLQTTKNGERRFIPLVGTALDLLRSKYANQAIDSLVFPAPHSPSKPIDIRSAWETSLKKAGIFQFPFS